MATTENASAIRDEKPDRFIDSQSISRLENDRGSDGDGGLNATPANAAYSIPAHRTTFSMEEGPRLADDRKRLERTTNRPAIGAFMPHTPESFANTFKHITTCHLIMHCFFHITTTTSTTTTATIKKIIRKFLGVVEFSKKFANRPNIFKNSPKLNSLLYLCWCGVILLRTTEAAASPFIIRHHHTTFIGSDSGLQEGGIKASHNSHTQHNSSTQQGLQIGLGQLNLSNKDASSGTGIQMTTTTKTTMKRRKGNGSGGEDRTGIPAGQHKIPRLHHVEERSVAELSAGPIIVHLVNQMDASLEKIRNLFMNYLKEINKKSQDQMDELWRLHDINITYPNRSALVSGNATKDNVTTFLLNMDGYRQIIEDIKCDTKRNWAQIEHGEDYTTGRIMAFFQDIQNELQRLIMEAEKCLSALNIPKPNLRTNHVNYNTNLQRKPRDYLVIRHLIQDIERSRRFLH